MADENPEEEIKDESKEERFKRLAATRVNKALDKIRLLGNLAKPQYEYTPEQVEQIIVALQSGIAEVEEKFQKKLDNKRKRFSF